MSNKIGKKRWNEKAEDLQEYRVCLACEKKFWAGSDMEYGNFYDYCKSCRKEREDKLEPYKSFDGEELIRRHEKLKKEMKKSEKIINKYHIK